MGRPRGSKNRVKKASKARAGVALKSRKGASRDAPVVRAKYTKRLPVECNDAEKAKLANELSKVTLELEVIENEKAEELRAFRERSSGLKDRQRELARCVKDTTKMQDVRCEERFDVGTNTIRVVRLDTLEVVEERAATADDRQEALPYAGPPKSLPTVAVPAPADDWPNPNDSGAHAGASPAVNGQPSPDA